MQQLGLEWLWRVKEEPFLWRRYWNDGRMLLRLLYTRILPLALYQLLLKNKWDSQEMFVTQFNNDTSVIIKIFGPGIRQHVSKIIPAFREAIAMKKRTVIDFSNTCAVDTRFLGLLLMLRKNLRESVSDLVLVGLSAELKRIFHLNGLDFLLAARQYDEPPQQMAANLTATESQEDITTTGTLALLGANRAEHIMSRLRWLPTPVGYRVSQQDITNRALSPFLEANLAEDINAGGSVR